MNIERICRICLKESNFYSHIYEKLFQYECLFYEIVNDVCQLDVNVEDGLSMFICSECSDKINEFHEFKKLAHNSGATLQRFKENSSNEKLKTDERISTDDERNYNFPKVFIKIEEDEEQLEEYSSETYESTYCGEESATNKTRAYVETNVGYEYADDSNDATTQTRTKMEVEPERHFIGNQTEIFLVPSKIKREYPVTTEKDPLEVEPEIVEISEHMLYKNESIINEPHPVAVVKEIHASRFHGYTYRAEERMMMSASASHENSENSRYIRFSRDYSQGPRFNHYPPPSIANYKRVCREDRKVKCDICGKGFPSNSHIIIHKRVHTGDKPFQCFTCGRSFSQVQNLAAHERTHTGEKPFKCPLCGKSFSNKSTLNKHGRIHSGERPFFCHLCGMSFAQKGNLKIHRQTVHN